MEFYLLLFSSVVLSIVVAFFLSKLFARQDSMLKSGEGFGGEVVSEERKFEGELKNQRMESDEKVEFFGEAARVDEFEGLLEQEKLGMVYNSVEFVKESSENVEIFEEGRIGEEEKDYEERVEIVGFEKGSVESDSNEVKDEKISNKNGGLEYKLVDKSPEKTKIPVIDTELLKEEQNLAKNEEIVIIGRENQGETLIERRERSGGEDENIEMFSDEDDWEGIERSELEKQFGKAVVFVGHGDKENRLSKVASEVQMELYGLHKIATEGTCREPQPMALNLSGRAKWNAWQQLGNMSPEEAMERYNAIISQYFPKWMRENPGEENEQDSLGAGISETWPPNLSTCLHHQMASENEREP